VPPQIEPDDWPHGRAQDWQDDHRVDSARYSLAQAKPIGTKICQTCHAEVPANAVLSVSAADQMSMLRKITGELVGVWAALICADCAGLLREAMNERDRTASVLGSKIHADTEQVRAVDKYGREIEYTRYREPPTMPKDGMWHE